MQKNIVSEQQNKFWFAVGRTVWRRSVVDLNDDDGAGIVQTISNLAWQDGARWAMRESARLSPHLAQFLEMCMLLGLFDEREPETSTGVRGETSSATSGDQSGDNHDDVSALPMPF